MKLLTFRTPHLTTLPSSDAVPERCHEWDPKSIAAVNAALAAKRPLLVRGEPGLGKSQLAEAAAKELGRAYYPFVVDAKTEARDLLWHFDAVLRLAEAQLYQTLQDVVEKDKVRSDLAVANFVQPGPLWWAFDTNGAKQINKTGSSPLDIPANKKAHKNGWVILVDEIDKGEIDVPNGLLEAFGSGQFTPMGHDQPVTIQGVPPLVIITTNEDRILPDAFVRRCLVLQLEFPKGQKAIQEYLVRRGQAHFGNKAAEEILTLAAELLVQDRAVAEREQVTPLPGQAEYLDLVRAVIGQDETDIEGQKRILQQAAEFTFQKHPFLRDTRGSS